MPFTDNGGLAALRARIEAVRAEIVPTMEAAADEIGNEVVTNLSAASPVGQYESAPVWDDAPGHLKDSFTAFVEGGAGDVTITVETNQANKLLLVTGGRGEVLPDVKKALFWQGLSHPVKRAGPTTANDFVTPVKTEADTYSGTIFHDTLESLMTQL